MRGITAQLLLTTLLFSAAFSASTSIILYPNSYSYVTRMYELESSGTFSLELAELQNVDFSSLSFFESGASIYLSTYEAVNKTRLVRKSLGDLLNESINSQITVRMADGRENTGTLVWYDDLHIGMQNGSLNIIPLSQLSSLFLPSSGSLYKEETYSANLLSLFGLSAKPNAKISVAYPKRGLSWSISYDLIPLSSSATLRQYATITNSGEERYDDADIKLTLINPNLQSLYYATRSAEFAYAEQAIKAGDISFRPLKESGVWSYKPSSPLTISPKGSQKLAIFTDEIPYEMKYVWDTNKGDAAYRTYNITNSRTEILPAGVVRVFENGEFMGEDSIGMMGSGSSSELFASDAPQFTVSKKIISDKTDRLLGDSTRHTIRIRLAVANYDAESQSIEVRDYIPQYSDLQIEEYSVQPATVDGGKIVWDININGGGEVQVIEYVYSYTSRY